MKRQLSNTIYGLKFAMEKNDFERLKSSSGKKRNDFVANPINFNRQYVRRSWLHAVYTHVIFTMCDAFITSYAYHAFDGRFIGDDNPEICIFQFNPFVTILKNSFFAFWAISRILLIVH